MSSTSSPSRQTNPRVLPAVLADFYALKLRYPHLTEADLVDFVNTNFRGEGEEPEGLKLHGLYPHPMLYDYVTATNDTPILERALSLAKVELAWWQTHRSVQVTSPFTNKTYSVARFAVHNTAPRPELYLTAYQTLHDPALPILPTTEQAAEMYSELASGAETGWDYSGRFEAIPACRSVGFALAKQSLMSSASLQTKHISCWLICMILPMCLRYLRTRAPPPRFGKPSSISTGSDADELASYDFNLMSNSRNSVFTMATFYPIWCGIVPNEVLESGEKAFGHFAALNMVMERYNGTMPTTFLDWTAHQWDAPDAWPPHRYIILQAPRALPSNITSSPAPSPPPSPSSCALAPASQLNMPEADLLSQPILGTSCNASATGPDVDISAMDGTIINVGRARGGEGWADRLQRELTNRYYTNLFPSQARTGRMLHSGLLDRLPDEQLALTNSVNNTGNVFILEVDLSGYGGEYTVQAGFGWTNSVLLCVAATYGDVLAAPECPLISTLDSPLVVSAEADAVVGDKDWQAMAGMVLVLLLGIAGQALFF
ncbi:glycoside hydrolase family 37 protein [Coniophora puteana RWD-64-598 SS2]|uniref:Trehalase n=1 Tax=Coniophora puteana (strain RWD-64-598) TaxID=741705 RepID=A0A5M3M897_CONPW|nr:glycoside hydrolase family 37 protein [Coniophora puteana RWD-64-598 SS2]EIW74891.1 glycoside hydrolase family 37 protein [Coniophora puteana RWD-64-598 SS2]